MSAPASSSAPPLLEIRNLSLSFDAGAQARRRVLRDVSLTMRSGECLAVVGESGSGKSLTALSILRLVPEPPARVDSGSILFQGQDLLKASPAQLRAVRGRRIAMIFQEPMTSLNPVHSVGWQIDEAIRLHQRVSRARARQMAIDAMQEVGIPEAFRRIDQYPHQFSGGMRQRVMIAMALACRPALLLADEPTTALDVTIAAQILDLLDHLRKAHNMAVMLISHDLGVVAKHADRVAVMYAGRIVEQAPTADLFANPVHPYTRALLQCAPRIGRHAPRLHTLADILNASGGANAITVRSGGESHQPWWPGERGDDAHSNHDDAVSVAIAPDHRVLCRAG